MDDCFEETGKERLQFIISVTTFDNSGRSEFLYQREACETGYFRYQLCYGSCTGEVCLQIFRRYGSGLVPRVPEGRLAERNGRL